uniref:Uncharacterized protein n=1 Tax=Anguilla anguilla TaxID=7936 RepID=A0A0E9RCJ6_ANGAN
MDNILYKDNQAKDIRLKSVQTKLISLYSGNLFFF